jgi:hypothetical protein
VGLPAAALPHGSRLWLKAQFIMPIALRSSVDSTSSRTQGDAKTISAPGSGLTLDEFKSNIRGSEWRQESVPKACAQIQAAELDERTLRDA